MSETIVAKLQNRRGRRADLPQPLEPGELGFCTDTGQLFIGGDPNDPAFPSTKLGQTIQLYTGAITDNGANTLLDKYIVQVELVGLLDPEQVAIDFFDSSGGRVQDWERYIVQQSVNRVYIGYDFQSRATITVDSGQNVTNVLITNAGYTYTSDFTVIFNAAQINFTVTSGRVTGSSIVVAPIGLGEGTYSLPMDAPSGPIVLPSPTYASEVDFFGAISTNPHDATRVEFISGEMDFSVNANYDGTDASVVANLLNISYATTDGFQSGVGNVQQNIEVTGGGTTAVPPTPSDCDCWVADIEMSPGSTALAESSSGYTNIPILTYSTGLADSFVVDYSLSSTSITVSAETVSYQRTGGLRITADVTGAFATLTDNYTENITLVPSGVPTESVSVDFKATFNTGAMTVSYITSAFTTGTILLKTTTRRWLSNP